MKLVAIAVGALLFIGVGVGGTLGVQHVTDDNSACDIWTAYLLRLSSGDPQESSQPKFLSPESIAWFKDAFAVRNAACQN